MFKRIPDGQGFAQLTEAVTSEFGALLDLVRQALREKLRATPGLADTYADIQGIWPDHVVCRLAGRVYRHPYTVNADNTITVGDGAEVVAEFKPVREAVREKIAGGEPGESATFTEAADGSIAVTIIRAGLSGNGNFYPDTALQGAVHLFEGVRVFAKSDAEHTKGAGKDVRNLLGGIFGVHFKPGPGADSGALQGTFRAIDQADPAVVKMTEAVKRGLQSLMGLSIDAEARIAKGRHGNRAVRVAREFVKVNSVDLIVEPGAGGGLDRLTEATDSRTNPSDGDSMFKQRLILALAAISAAAAAKFNDESSTASVLVGLREACAGKKIDADAVIAAAEGADKDEAVATAVTRLVEAAEAKAQADADAAAKARLTEGKGSGDEAPVTRAEMALHQARLYASSAIAASTLPQVAKTKLQAEFRARERFTEAQVDEAITAEREYLAKFTESGKATGGMPRIELGDRTVQVADMLDAFFDPKHKNHREVRSFKECYVEITGDKHVTGIVDRARLTESIGTDTFAQALGNSITRRMQASYRDQVAYDAWRAVVSTAPVNDFRTQERTQIGGFGDLPTVAERGPYTAFADPSDDAATYAVIKRGGKVEVTMESIKNDDVGAMRRLPVELGRAAKRTLFKFVFNFFAANPTIYDTLALYHATHANLFTAALDATSLSAHRLAMKKQTGRDTAMRMGIGPKFLLVPDDLQEAAVNLFNRTTNNDKTFVQANALEIIPVPSWTDVNDWVSVADPMDIPVLEIGFLDGQEEPVLLMQDSPTEGQVFTNDILSYKIRHIYGGNVLVDGWKGTTKAVVA